MKRIPKHKEAAMSAKKRETVASKDWKVLNDFLRTCDEAGALQKLKEEKRGQKRETFMLRIHSRLNKLRADRERNELQKKVG